MKKTLIAFALIAVSGTAYAHGFQQQPSLLGGLLSGGNHGGIANVGARLLSPSSLADVHANVLGAVKANVDVGQSDRHGSTLLGISATVLDGGVGNRPGRW